PAARGAEARCGIDRGPAGRADHARSVRGPHDGQDWSMAQTRYDLSPEAIHFLEERHLATLTTLRPDGSPHVVPVGCSYDPSSGLARAHSFAARQKVRHLAAAGRAAVSQVDGGRCYTLEGPATVAVVPD